MNANVKPEQLGLGDRLQAMADHLPPTMLRDWIFERCASADRIEAAQVVEHLRTTSRLANGLAREHWTAALARALLRCDFATLNVDGLAMTLAHLARIPLQDAESIAGGLCRSRTRPPVHLVVLVCAQGSEALEALLRYAQSDFSRPLASLDKAIDDYYFESDRLKGVISRGLGSASTEWEHHPTTDYYRSVLLFLEACGSARDGVSEARRSAFCRAVQQAVSDNMWNQSSAGWLNVMRTFPSLPIDLNRMDAAVRRLMYLREPRDWEFLALAAASGLTLALCSGEVVKSVLEHNDNAFTLLTCLWNPTVGPLPYSTEATRRLWEPIVVAYRRALETCLLPHELVNLVAQYALSETTPQGQQTVDQPVFFNED